MFLCFFHDPPKPMEMGVSCKWGVFPYSILLNYRHSNEMKRNECPKSLFMQILLMDGDNSSSVSNTEF